MKRGEFLQVNNLNHMVMALFIAIILFMFLKNSGIFTTEVSAHETCKRSVQNYVKLNIPGVDIKTTESIRCPVVNKEITSKDEERIKSEIAKEMYNCFDKFGAGEYEGRLFETRRNSVDNYCVVCSKVTFSNKGKIISGLPQYLAETDVPGMDISYNEYFAGTQFKTQTNNMLILDSNKQITSNTNFEKTPINIDTSKSYAVIFSYDKSTGWWDKMSAGAIAGTAGLVVGGFIAGFFTGGATWILVGATVVGTSGMGIAMVKAPWLESQSQSGTIFAPYEDLQKYLHCTEIPIKQ